MNQIINYIFNMEIHCRIQTKLKFRQKGIHLYTLCRTLFKKNKNKEPNLLLSFVLLRLTKRPQNSLYSVNLSESTKPAAPTWPTLTYYRLGGKLQTLQKPSGRDYHLLSYTARDFPLLKRWRGKKAAADGRNLMEAPRFTEEMNDPSQAFQGPFEVQVCGL